MIPSRLFLTGPRLLAGFGTLTLLAGLGLLASRPAHTAGGPIPVSVANTPLAVTSADAPYQQPFQAITAYTIPNGSIFSVTLTKGVPPITVPAGKRLIIQTVSVNENNPNGQNMRAYIEPVSNGVIEGYVLPLVTYSDADPFQGVTQAVTLSADPGSTIKFGVIAMVSPGITKSIALSPVTS